MPPPSNSRQITGSQTRGISTSNSAPEPTGNLFARVPLGNASQTYLREIVLVADHTAYHVGQLVLTRRLLGIWS